MMFLFSYLLAGRDQTIVSHHIDWDDQRGPYWSFVACTLAIVGDVIYTHHYSKWYYGGSHRNEENVGKLPKQEGWKVCLSSNQAGKTLWKLNGKHSSFSFHPCSFTRMLFSSLASAGFSLFSSSLLFISLYSCLCTLFLAHSLDVFRSTFFRTYPTCSEHVSYV